MNYFIKIIAAIVFATLSINTYAQTIKTAINSEAANNVKFLNMESKKYFVHDAEYPEFEAMEFVSKPLVGAELLTVVVSFNAEPAANAVGINIIPTKNTNSIEIVKIFLVILIPSLFNFF